VSARRLPWIIAAAAVLALGALVIFAQRGNATIHPTPRPGITSANVLPEAVLPHVAGAAEAYAAARAMPQVLDGVFCHCECARNFGHRSLLTCFESEHGSQCDICMGEAMMAAQLASQGNSLDQIRSAIDVQFAHR
jgi:hypothetical protein